ncbi:MULTISPECIES: DUF6624 domain-containing protein [unclassified Duganella]|uniref:DUF6624 domain-containing protein n=1 Tax=unclassified Duganella TaxID=2636909 RepID=UPI000886B42E|nr:MULTISPECIES: DUF6624 domain-containing protein [unclassified Duganella]SDG50517.1 hypothetical protein SAMN05216320_10510 [Duganella sp. OV458]SDJ73192.1 hypothetical protein SAMN05428973_10610 [Duganella sp. OV510]
MKIVSPCALVLASLLLPIFAHADECEKTALARKYAQMHSEDQALRGRYIKILESEHRKQTIDPNEKEQLEIKISDIDEANQRELDRLLAKCGWPGKLDGKRAAFSAFIIIQHAPLDYQLKHFDFVKAANERGEIPSNKFAWLVDRILVKQGKPQLYGTEFEYGSNRVAPIADPDNLNARRKKMGLPPFSEH